MLYPQDPENKKSRVCACESSMPFLEHVNSINVLFNNAYFQCKLFYMILNTKHFPRDSPTRDHWNTKLRKWKERRAFLAALLVSLNRWEDRNIHKGHSLDSQPMLAKRQWASFWTVGNSHWSMLINPAGDLPTVAIIRSGYLQVSEFV